MADALGTNMDIPIEEKRKLEVERILKCQPDDSHAILEVQHNCVPLVARRAALQKFLLIKDRFETGPEDMKEKANEATKMISEAANKLQVMDQYVEIDQNNRTATPPSASQPYNPSPNVKEIYEKATASVLVLFSDAEDTSLAEMQIHQHNEEIRDVIREDNPNATTLEQISGFIGISTFKNYTELRKIHKTLADRDTTALTQIEKEESEASERILGSMGSVIDDFNARKGYPPTWNWDKQKNPEVWKTVPSTAKQTGYGPGQTEDGELILGYIPTLKMDLQGNEYINRCSFAVEAEDLGNLKIMTWQELGRERGQAYLDQPDKDKVDISGSTERYKTPRQKARYENLLGFYSEYSANPNRWGTSYCYIELKDGGRDVVSKSCFHTLVPGGREAAMDKIYDLFDRDPTKYSWRNPSLSRANNRMIEGPHGPRKIQTRKMIENGSHTNQQVHIVNANNIQPHNTMADVTLTDLLQKLTLESVQNAARMTEMESRFQELISIVEKLGR